MCFLLQSKFFRNPPRIIMMLRKFSPSSADTVMRFLVIVWSVSEVCRAQTHGYTCTSLSLRICRPNNCMRTSFGSALADRFSWCLQVRNANDSPVAASMYRVPASRNVWPTPAVDQGDFRARNNHPVSIVIPATGG